ncbi:MAG: NAD-dependent epimerase/dehydratase family protein [Acidobacteria bacterium]|nr:NAD-dependent epimerase/dehydratase family protein [Acidobacteriota bacterium]
MSFWIDKKVLVTGGASFIGSHLVEKLVSLGAHARVADDLSSGKKENLKKVAGHIEFVQADLRDRCAAADAVCRMEVIFHLAAKHGGRGYIDTHPADCSSNMALDGTLFEAAVKADVEHICFASSACVYPVGLQNKSDRPAMNLKEEDADPFKPGGALADGEYGWAKLMGEMALQAYHKQYGLKCASCRIFTAYGERENETHALMALIAKAFVQVDPYIVWGTGEQDRNFTYVGDIVEGLVLAAEKIEDGSAVNLGSSEHIKIKDAAQSILGIMGFRPKQIVFDTSKPCGVFSRAADLSRAQCLLGWQPRLSFKDGLKRTINWYLASKDRDEVLRNLDVRLCERESS